MARPDRHMAYMTPDEIARQHAAFFGSYVGFLVVSSAAGLLLAFFHKIQALMKYPALRVVVEPEDFITREEDDGSLDLRDPIKEAEDLMKEHRQRNGEDSDFAFDERHKELVTQKRFQKQQAKRKGTKDEGIDMDFHF